MSKHPPFTQVGDTGGKRGAAQSSPEQTTLEQTTTAALLKALVKPTTIDDLSYHILEYAKQLTSSQFGYVGHIDPETGHLICSTMTRDIWEDCQVPEKSIVFEKFGGLWGWVLEHRCPLLTNTPQKHLHSSGVPQGHLPIQRFLSAPALVGDEILGQIALANPGRDYVDRDLNIVKQLADIYALAVQRYFAQEKDRFQTQLLYNVRESIIATDLEGHITYWGQGAEKLYGYRANEVLGHKIARLVVEPTERRAQMDQVRDTGSWQGHSQQIRKDGTTFLADTSISLVKDRHGDPSGMVGIDRDISEEIETRRALHLTRQRLADILGSISDGFFTLDPELRVTYFNKAAERILNRARSEVLGQPLFDAFPEAKGSIFEEKYRWALEHQERLTFEAYFETAPYADWYDVTVTPFEQGISVYFQVITERKQNQLALQKQTEALARSNTDLQHFAYAASHDLQEPLRMVISYLQLLERRLGDTLDETTASYIDYAVESAVHMRAMVKGLLAYSKVGLQHQPHEPAEANQAFEQALANLELMIQQHKVNVTRNPLPTVPIDSIQLQRVFQNLIDNAIKFRGENAPRVEVSAERRGDEWIFAVRDNGLGIAPENQERIFDVFERLHSRDEYAGAGIGLALCKRIIEQHGGTLWVESEPGEGSTFYFTLPVTI